MKFVKILNNNIAIVADEAGEDRIVMGCGVAFGKKYGDPVDVTRIERIFTQNVRDLSGKFEALLKEIPDEYLECADRIIAHGKLLLGKELADNLYLSLTDHIFFTVKRCREGMLIHNRLLFETKMIYKEEFQVGMDAVEMMNRQFDINLPEDERNRLIDAEWQVPEDATSGERYSTEIKIYANNRIGMFADISKVFTERQIDITSMNVRTSKQGKATIIMTFDIHGMEELGRLTDKIRQIEGVLDIERTAG